MAKYRTETVSLGTYNIRTVYGLYTPGDGVVVHSEDRVLLDHIADLLNDEATHGDTARSRPSANGSARNPGP